MYLFIYLIFVVLTNHKVKLTNEFSTICVAGKKRFTSATTRLLLIYSKGNMS